ncbi:PqiB family protein [Geminicoccus flavidas]|uniref:PqiB family protein n=1 Tax=Geminicoccus flavidas TaxID=2506407 RepID=UPI0013589E53|nr:MlaD family protein [Geminicoccus flavidas]
MSDAIYRPQRRFSLIWLVPIVAGLLGIWLAVTTLLEQGPTVRITFQTADGLEAGKTKLKYKDVEIGTVTDVQFSDHFSDVVAVADIDKDAAGLMANGTKLWIVRPQLGISGVSGLGTLLSGSYIAIDPGQGERQESFTGLEEPPPLQSDAPGRRYVLHSETLGSISRGAPISYLGITIGKVLDYRLDAGRSGLIIDIFVNSPHDEMIRDSSRFWNASGIDVSIGGDGVNVKLASLRSLLIGGIEVETPDLDIPGEPSAEGHAYTLFDSHDEVITAGYSERIPLLAYFEGSVRGLRVGAPVEFSGIQIGTVTDIALEYERDTSGFRIAVGFEVEPDRVRPIGQRLVDVDPYIALDQFVARGLRAKLKSGNLLTGELIVSLEFVPDAPPAKAKRIGSRVEVPTAASDMDQIARSAEGFLDQLSKLDLPKLMDEVRKTVASVNALVGAPEMKDIIVQLDRSLGSVERIAASVEGQSGPLVASLRKVADDAARLTEQARMTLVSVDGVIGQQAPIPTETRVLMKELISATRSIRMFADYLDRHPEALIRGKAGGSQ